MRIVKDFYQKTQLWKIPSCHHYVLTFHHAHHGHDLILLLTYCRKASSSLMLHQNSSVTHQLHFLI
jgi:hypothetical protein